MSKMEVFEAIKIRRSIRAYQDRPVEEKKLQKILEAGRLSPSAVNRQPWSFIVISDPRMKEQMLEAYNRSWFVKAPIIIVACAFPEQAWRRSDEEEFWKIDVAIAFQSLILAATAEGLGTCWVGAFDERKVKLALGIPEKVRVVAMTPLGYAAEQKGPVSERKPIVEIIRNDHW
jgi:nitroreductase